MGPGWARRGTDGGAEGLAPLHSVTLILFPSLLEDNLSHRPLANCHSGEQLFTQDVRPEQLLEGKV